MRSTAGLSASAIYSFGQQVRHGSPGGSAGNWLTRLHEEELQVRQGHLVGSKQFCFQPLSLVAQSLVGCPIGLKTFRLAVRRKCAHQRQVALLDLNVARILADAKNRKGV